MMNDNVSFSYLKTPIRKSSNFITQEKQKGFVIRYQQRQIKSENNLKSSLSSKKSKLKNYEQQISIPSHNNMQKEFNLSKTKLLKPIRHHESIQKFPIPSRIEDKQKQYSKVPIEYYDEKFNGCGADRLRARIVFRGYSPKNTYFYFRTIKEANVIIRSESIVRSKTDLTFNSKFQSGNLLAAARISENQYWLYMRQDTNTHGLRQWFYFEAMNQKPITIKFRIYRFSKSFSLYKKGLKPFVKKSGNVNWEQSGEMIKYAYDEDQKCYFLQFTYQFTEQQGSTYFATLPPYTYTNLMRYLEILKEQHNQINIKTLGQSLGGLSIPIIQIRKSKSPGKKDKNQNNLEYGQGKKLIFITARIHPGQTVSNFALEGLLQKILDEPQIRNQFDFSIIPMVNPDGVFLGNHRTGAAGIDLNRCFLKDNADLFPQVFLVYNQIQRLKKNYQISFFFDLHGHSARKNIFAYGQEFQIGTQRYLKSHILPKLVSQNISTFKYDYCVFKASKVKKNTGRIYISNRLKIDALTFQQSYGRFDEGAMNTIHWKNFGIALAQSLKTYAQMMKKGGLSQIQAHLQDQIQKQKIKIEKKIDQQKKLFELPIVHKFSLKNSSLQMTNNEFNKYSSETQQQKIYQQIRQEEKVQEYQTKSQGEESSSPCASELSSGDDQLEIQQQELEQLNKQIVKVGCLKEGVKRQLFSIADKKLQLKTWQYNSQSKLHGIRESMISRIVKQMNKKQGFFPVSHSLNQKFQLPNIRTKQS